MTLQVDCIHQGDCRDLLPQIEPNSIALSFWSPPYHVGKKYEAGVSFEDWQNLLREAIALHFPIVKPGCFLAINIGDILVFRDETMPKIQAENPSRHKSKITREMVLAAQEEHPDYNRYQLAEFLGCSEQTIDRRLHGNNIRGGKYATQTRIKIVGGMIEQYALDAGFYLYDQRIWVKDAAWKNSEWHTLSYRAVDEYEHVYVLWKPGITVVDRKRLRREEWVQWGSRGVWNIPSVRVNNDHEAKFPIELPRRVIKLLTAKGDTVLDCFMGSGTTAVAAIREGRHYIGIELLPQYVKLSRKNVEEEKRKRAILGETIMPHEEITDSHSQLPLISNE